VETQAETPAGAAGTGDAASAPVPGRDAAPESERPEPAAETVLDPDEPAESKLVLPGGPTVAIAAESAAAAGAGLFHAGGWSAVAAGAVVAGGAGVAVIARRRRGSSWKRTRSTSTSASPGRAGSSGTPRRSTGSWSSPGSRRSPGRAGSAMPKGAGGRGRGSGSMPGTGRRGTGAGTRGGRGSGTGGGARGRAPGSARRAAALGATGAGAARRAAKAASAGGGRAFDRAANGTGRRRAAAAAANRALRNGATPKQAAKAARQAARKYKAKQGRMTRMRRAGGRWLAARLLEWMAGVNGGLRELVDLRPGKTTKGDAAPQRRINTTVNRPANPEAETGYGGKTMAGGGTPPFVTAAEELADALRRYQPPPGPGGMVQLYYDVGMLPDMLEQIARGFGQMADRARDEWPLHNAISELIGELAKVQAHMATVSAEIKPAIAKLHEADLERHRTPRPGEPMWNVS
jgi:hypothetical protein